MRADLEKRNILFKTKNTNKQLVSSSQEGNEWHNTMEGGWTHSEEAEVVDMIRKHQ
jgi:hypothetical protein